MAGDPEKNVFDMTGTTPGDFLMIGKGVLAKQVLEILDDKNLTAEEKVRQVRALVRSFVSKG